MQEIEYTQTEKGRIREYQNILEHQQGDCWYKMLSKKTER